jgi:hypothetical protein
VSGGQESPPHLVDTVYSIQYTGSLDPIPDAIGDAIGPINSIGIGPPPDAIEDAIGSIGIAVMSEVRSQKSGTEIR